MVQLLEICIGAAGITVSHLIRDTRQDWEDTNGIYSLQDMRTATKMNSGNSFDIDNKELLHILSNTFSATALEYVILSYHRIQNGTMACNIIKKNIYSASYNKKLKIQGGAIIEHAF